MLDHINFAGRMANGVVIHVLPAAAVIVVVTGDIRF